MHSLCSLRGTFDPCVIFHARVQIALPHAGRLRSEHPVFLDPVCPVTQRRDVRYREEA